LTRSVCPVVIKDLKGEQTMLLFYSLEVVVENIAGVPTHYITCTLHGVMALWNNFFTIDFLSKNKPCAVTSPCASIPHTKSYWLLTGLCFSFRRLNVMTSTWCGKHFWSEWSRSDQPCRHSSSVRNGGSWFPLSDPEERAIYSGPLMKSS
jgi:hypothetical protein